MNISEEHYIETLRAYDRTVILMDRIIEHFLHGNCNPPKELIDTYFDAVDEAEEFLNYGRLHEQVVPPNSDFFLEIEKKFSLSSQSEVDNSPSA